MPSVCCCSNIASEQDMNIGKPQQCVASLCVRGNAISTKYYVFRWMLGIIIISVTIFSFIYYFIPLFDTQYDPTRFYSNIAKCCYLYWIFYISSWYLITATFYVLIIIYLQCIVVRGYYQKSSINNSDKSIRNLFITQFKGFFNDLLFQMMRFFHLFSVSSSSIYIIIYWISINNETYSDSFKNINNPSDLNDIFTSVPLSFFMLILENGIIPILIFIDFFTNFLWFKYKDCIVVNIMILCYFGLLYIHDLMQFTNEFGHSYIYKQINFNEKYQIQSLIICLIFIFIINGWLLLLIFIKRQLIYKWIKNNSGWIDIDVDIDIDHHQTHDIASDAASSRDLV